MVACSHGQVERRFFIPVRDWNKHKLVLLRAIGVVLDDGGKHGIGGLGASAKSLDANTFVDKLP